MPRSALLSIFDRTVEPGATKMYAMIATHTMPPKARVLSVYFQIIVVYNRLKIVLNNPSEGASRANRGRRQFHS